MRIAQKLTNLRKTIDERVLPLINADYVFWGLPYYDNPGDTLIWEGTIEMLKKCPHKCIGTFGCGRCRPVPIEKKIVILVAGGGFFGDLWRPGWENIMDTISCYPDNPIIILPQSICYEKEDALVHDAEIFKTLKNLTICVRDRKSLQFAIRQFGNDVRLVPDMAFYADIGRFKRFERPSNGRRLYIVRHDKERSENAEEITGEDVDCGDWPIMTDNRPRSLKRISKIVKFFKKHVALSLGERIECFLYRCFAKDIALKGAVEFISAYDEVYSTRLHGAILAAMLEKNVFVLDNNYGKLSGCFNEWLNDCDSCTVL